MTFLQALYGSQYKELSESGRDASKGRMNGNMFLSAFIIIVLIVLFLAIFKFMPVHLAAPDSGLSGKTIGKLLAIPVFGLIYFVIIKTVGTETNYQKIVSEFNQLPEEEKAGANKRILIPFFILLGFMLLFMFV